MSKIFQIFIPESIPLENKGEEAILRGIQDLLFPEGNVHFHILAINCKLPYTTGNLTIYPRKWFYSSLVFRELRWSFNLLDMINAAGVLAEAFQNRVPFLVKRPHFQLKVNDRLIKKGRFLFRKNSIRESALHDLTNIDFVIAGHDQAFYLRETHLLKSLLKFGLKYGILGCGMNSNFANRSVVDVYRSVFQHAKFLYFRDKVTYSGIVRHFKDLDPVLAPDPAFAMRPCIKEEVDRIIDVEKLGLLFKRPVVAITVVENAIIMKSFDKEKYWSQKLIAHRKLIAGLVAYIIDEWKANVLFLPHCIGPTINLDDRRVAVDILAHLKGKTDKVRILKTEYSARQLKGLIQRADLLIGERIHSIIGAVSVATPFICLGSSRDPRATGIVAECCGGGDLIYDLKQPDLSELCLFAAEVWKRRDKVHEHLKNISERLNAELEQAASTIKPHIYKSKDQ